MKAVTANIAIVTTSIIRNISPRIERIQGYKNALENHRLNVNSDYVKTADADAIPSALEELFELEEPPEAILAGNDIRAHGSIEIYKKS